MNQIIFVLFSVPVLSIIFIAGWQFWDEMFGNKPLFTRQPFSKPAPVLVETPVDLLWHGNSALAE